jgi:mono/diheme cytochrome c family protein
MVHPDSPGREFLKEEVEGMRYLIALLVLLVLAIAALAVYAWSGIYNVSAAVPHFGLTEWLLEETRERSILRHSRGVTLPPVGEPQILQDGLAHFHEMCRLCHGAPGYPETEIAHGLYPSPPELADKEVQSELTDPMIFWIVQNGIKMTGMPSFGETHSAEEISAIVSFIRLLPKLSPEQYRDLSSKAGALTEKEEAGQPHR